MLGDVLTHTYQIMQKIEKYCEVISFLYSVPPASCRPVPPAAATLSALSLSQPAVSRPVTAPRYLKQVTLLHLKVHFIENKIYLMHPQ